MRFIGSIKCRRRIGVCEAHHYKLVMAVMSEKSDIWYAFLMYLKLVVARLQLFF